MHRNAIAWPTLDLTTDSGEHNAAESTDDTAVAADEAAAVEPDETDTDTNETESDAR